MYNYKIKIIIVGDANVGKSCIATRFQYNKFDSSYEITIGVEFFSKIIEIDNNKIKIQIWDTAGQETFNSLVKSYFRNINGCLLTFDLTDRESFTNIENWLNKVVTESNTDVTYILVGNKSDKIEKRSILYEEAVAFSKRYKMDYIETSALNARNIYNLFYLITQTILEKYNTYKQFNRINFRKNFDDEDDNNNCCYYF